MGTVVFYTLYVANAVVQASVECQSAMISLASCSPRVSHVVDFATFTLAAVGHLVLTALGW